MLECCQEVSKLKPPAYFNLEKLTEKQTENEKNTDKHQTFLLIELKKRDDRF